MIRSAKPERIPTSVRKISVLNPVFLPQAGYYDPKSMQMKTWEGNPSTVDFKAQANNYNALSEILKRNGQSFDWIGMAKYTGEADYIRRYDKPDAKAMLTRFVATSPVLVWEKYEGATAGGGRNEVYVGGAKMKLTEFLALSPEEQDDYIHGRVDTTTKYEYVLTIMVPSTAFTSNKKFVEVMKKFGQVTKAYHIKYESWVYVSAELFYKSPEELNTAQAAAQKAFGDKIGPNGKIKKSRRMIK